MRSLHVAVLDEELPFPLTSGKRIRTFNLLAGSPTGTASPSSATATPTATRPPRPSRVPRARHRNGRRRSGGAAEVRARVLRPARRQPALAAAVLRRHPRQPGAGRRPSRELAANDPVDLWHCEWTPYAQVLRDALGDELAARPVGGDGPQRRVAHLAAVRRGRGEPGEAVVRPPAVAEVRAVRAVGVLRRDRPRSPSAPTTPS